MFRFFIDAISKGLAFSKAEAKGTFLLIILVLLSITSFRFLTAKIKTTSESEYDPSELSAWVEKMEASYSVKKEVKRKEDQSKIVAYQKIETEQNSWKANRSSKEKSALKSEVVKPPVMDLNTASAEQLQMVKGIGKAYSERIIKYREMLGGYFSTEQLHEVYGLSGEVIAKITEQFSIQSEVNKLAINSDSVKHLARHPYLSYDMAWVIINYRKQNGNISNYEDLSEIKALDDSTVLKLKPYLEK